MHFGTGKVDTLVTTSATGATLATRVQASGESPQRGLGWKWPLHFFQFFLRLMQIQSTKTKLVHVSTTASSSSAMLVQTRRDTHDRRDTLGTTRATRNTHTTHLTNPLTVANFAVVNGLAKCVVCVSNTSCETLKGSSQR